MNGAIFTTNCNNYKVYTINDNRPAERLIELAVERSCVAGTLSAAGSSVPTGASGAVIIGLPQILDHCSSLLSSSTQIVPNMSSV